MLLDGMAFFLETDVCHVESDQDSSETFCDIWRDMRGNSLHRPNRQSRAKDELNFCSKEKRRVNLDVPGPILDPWLQMSQQYTLNQSEKLPEECLARREPHSVMTRCLERGTRDRVEVGAPARYYCNERPKALICRRRMTTRRFGPAAASQDSDEYPVDRSRHVLACAP